MRIKIIVLTLLTGSSIASIANAADGTINFTGTILSAACTVTPATGTQTVPLNSVTTSSLSTAGVTSSPTKFDIVLTSCPSTVSTATVKFDGPTDSDNSSILKLTTEPGVATGVGIALYEKDASTQIPIGTSSTSSTLSTTSDTTFTFYAKYMATKAVTSGPANGSTDFTINYN
ncbi:fimbrial protein [Pseudomonas fragi]|uniref:fimbrial protein n=1 Tax=Pseudomonas fragi TaxID=296 RepID=UPI000BA26630|nr:fimbrial protein [Pseudomonas fragi]PAA09511.1 hypothetical protein CJU74_23655 [Pseudomonas fragi]